MRALASGTLDYPLMLGFPKILPAINHLSQVYCFPFVLPHKSSR